MKPVKHPNILAGLVVGTTAMATGQELSIIIGVIIAAIVGPVILKWRNKKFEKAIQRR